MQQAHLPSRARLARPPRGGEQPFEPQGWESNAALLEAMGQAPQEEEGGPQEADRLIQALLGGLPDEEQGPAARSTPDVPAQVAAGLLPELPFGASPELGGLSPASPDQAVFAQAPVVSGDELLGDGPEEAEAEAVADTVAEAVGPAGPGTQRDAAFDAAFEAETGVAPETIPVTAQAPQTSAEGLAQRGEVVVPAEVAAPQGEEQTRTLAHELAHVALGHTDGEAAARGRNAASTGLSRGAQGADVLALQGSLVKLGFLSSSDFKSGPGSFGPRTEAALQGFQTAMGLDPSGVYGSASSSALSAALTRRAATSEAVKTKGAEAFAGGVPAAGLKSGDEGRGVAKLQEALIRLGHLGADVRQSGLGTFGPRTEAALMAFQRASGVDPAGVYGPRSYKALAAALGQGGGATSSTTTPTTGTTTPTTGTAGTAPTSKLDVWDKEAPKADYRRTWFRGVQMNRRTLALVKRAEWIMQNELGYAGFSFSFGQGSYNTGVEASAGTHDGGGALDVRDAGLSRKKVDAMVKALRMAGFAAWSRGRGHDSFDPHIHAIAIGDKEAAWLAKQQVGDYAKGRNGLSNHAADPDAKLGRDMPSWARKIVKR